MHAGKRARQSDTVQPSDRPGEWKEEEEEGKTNTNWIKSCQSAGEATEEEQGEEEGGGGDEREVEMPGRGGRETTPPAQEAHAWTERHALILAGCCFHCELLAQRFAGHCIRELRHRRTDGQTPVLFSELKGFDIYIFLADAARPPSPFPGRSGRRPCRGPASPAQSSSSPSAPPSGRCP